MLRQNVVWMLLPVFSLVGCMPAEKEQKSEVAQVAVADKLVQATQQDIDQLAATLDVKYKHLTNVPSAQCDEKKGDGACFEVELSFTAKEDSLVNGWQIYFSQITPIQSGSSDWFEVSHINGDMHQVMLKPTFNGFKAGEAKSLVFRANFWSLSETDALPNYIIVADGLAPRVIESTKAIIDQETGLEVLPYVAGYSADDESIKRTATDKTKLLTAERLFERNVKVNDKAVDTSARIIPKPSQVTYSAQSGQLDLSSGIKVTASNNNAEDIQVALDRLASLGVKQSDNGVPVKLALSEQKGEKLGSYKMTVAESGIRISAGDGSGLFYALQSLASLVSLDDPKVPYLTVDDAPHYAFRGVLVDMSRNFHGEAFIHSLMDQMAAYKLNKLHLHLGDDEGWRLEVPGLPELTEISSKRCFDPSEQNCLMPQLGAGTDANASVNGYFSVEEYKALLKAATARHIQVIPSLDMPGHSRAAVKAMTARYHRYMAKEQEEKALEYLLEDFDDKTQYSSVQYYNDNTINVCMESSYHFVRKVMKEVKAMHAEAGQPLTRYHIGADETAGAWVESPKCKTFLAEHGAEIASAKELGAYFVERVSNILAELDIEAAAWIDGLEHTNPDNMPAVVQANAWTPLPWGSHKHTHKLANYNWQIVVSTPDATYFDFPYEADPKEHGYYWASRQINTEKVFQFMPDNIPVHAEFWLDREDKAYVADDTEQVDKEGKVTHKPLNKGTQFLGLQGQLWSENTRTNNTAEYKIFPRLLALAERAWHLPEWAVPYNYEGFKYSQDTNVFTNELETARDQDWKEFAHTLGQRELAKLELSGIHFRLPTAGAKVIDGKLHANTAFPGLAIEYRIDGGNWQAYEAPVAVSGSVEVRTKGYNGSRFSRATPLAIQP